MYPMVTAEKKKHQKQQQNSLLPPNFVQNVPKKDSNCQGVGGGGGGGGWLGRFTPEGFWTITLGRLKITYFQRRNLI